MARPQKNNADYFPHDANMRDDPKIKALRARHGLTGYAIWCILLETLTDADNFTLTWDELTQELTAGDIGIPTETLLQITEYLQKLQLITIADGKLYTARHHQRMQPIIELRERKRQWKQEKNGFSPSQTPPKQISDGENQQSKVKESKLKETKGERENAPAHEDKNFEKQKNQDLNHIADTIETHCNTDDGLRELITWKKRAGYRDSIHGPTTAELQKFISHYIGPIRDSGDPLAYFRDHFPAWLARAVQYNTPKKDTAPRYEPPPPHQRQPRTNSNAIPTTIGTIAGKIITEIAQ